VARDNGAATLKRLPPKVLGLPHPLLEVGELSAVVGKLGTGQDLLLEKLARPSPIVFGVLVQYGNWQAPFIVAACLLLGGACIWAFWLSRETSVLEGSEPETTNLVKARKTSAL